MSDDKPPPDDETRNEPFDTRQVVEPLEQLRDLVQGWTSSLVGSLERLAGDLAAGAGPLRAGSSQLGRAMQSWMQPLMTAARATPRAGRIAREVAAVFGAYRWHEMRVRGLTAEAVRAEREALDRRSAGRIAGALLELRGAALALGRRAATRRDLLPPAWREALARLDAPVPPAPAAAIRARIADQLGAPVEERFASFDDEPLAAAPLAQVHGAALPDGTPVAVRAQLPGAEEQVDGDLSLLSVLGGVLGDLAPTLDLAPLADELGRTLREELDDRLAARRADRVAALLADDPDLRVPRVIPALSAGRVLTVERASGAPLGQVLAAARAPAAGGAGEQSRLLAALVRATAAQILGLGLVPAGPGPEQLAVAPDGRLVLDLLGGWIELPPGARRALAALAAAVIASDRGRAAEHLAELGLAPGPGADPAELAGIADLLIGGFQEAGPPPGAALDQALEHAGRARIAVPHHAVEVGRVVAAVAGLVLAEQAAIDVPALLAPHLAAASAPDSSAAPGPADSATS